MTLRQALLGGRRRPRLRADGSPLNYRGDGYEFVELREYVHGDDVRRIDWAASARSTQLQTRIYLEDVALTLAVYIDSSASMQAGRSRSLFDAAQDAKHEWLQAALRTDRTLELDSLEDAVALPRGSALLVVSDFFWYAPADSAQRDLLALLAHRLDCTALVARDPWQDLLPFSGFVRLRDAESGDARVLFFGERERERYAAASRERERSIVGALEGYGWRAGIAEEEDGAAGLRHAFGI